MIGWPRSPGSMHFQFGHAVATLAALALLSVTVLTGCRDIPSALTGLIDARQRASALHVEFTKAADASNRAVMADTDDASAAAADEARKGRELAERNLQALKPLLDSLGYRDDLRYLEGFAGRFDEYRKLDDEILPLAVENSNLKAQRLSFGAGREAADAMSTALAAVVNTSSTPGRTRADTLAARARIGVLEVQVLQAPHIAEPEDSEMTRLEEQMSAAAGAARKALEELKAIAPASASAQVAAAGAALTRFMEVNAEIVTLSRRNTNVRSLALSLGRKRNVTAECEDQLRALEQALARHEFTATR